MRLTVAGLALATAAVGTIGGPAHADVGTPTGTPTTSTVAAPASTSISIRAIKPRINPGGADTITGNLNVTGLADAAGREVTLEAKAPGEADFVPVGTAIAAAYGGLRLSIQPEVSTLYRWSYAGAADAAAQTSGIVSVTVREAQHHAYRLATSLSVRSVDRPGNDIVRGKLRAGRSDLNHRLVVLLAQTADQSGWRYVGAHRTGRDGVVRFQVGPDTATDYRLQFPGTQVFRPAGSGVVRVAPSPAVSILATPTSIDPGTSTVVSGTVTTGLQAPLSGAVVDLVARATGTRQSFAVVGTGTTATDGTVSITATPTRATTYRLRVRATSATAETVSLATTVSVRSASSLSIRGRTTTYGTTIVTGTLRSQGHPVRGAVVTLMAQAPGTTTWVQVGTAQSAKRGGVEFEQSTVAGTGYRLEFAGDQRLAPSSSGIVVG